MPRKWKQIRLLLRSPLGRLQLFAAVHSRFWPILRWLASSYRRTVVRKTRIVAVVGSFGKTTTMRAVTAALGREVHPRAWLNARNNVARAVLRIRPANRHAVIEVGIAFPGQMSTYARLIRPNRGVHS